MDWVSHESPQLFSWLMQELTDCEKTLLELGRWDVLVSRARSRLRSMLQQITGVFERRPVWDMLSDLYFMMERGEALVVGDNVCSAGVCINIYDLMIAFNDYYVTLRERNRSLKDAEFYCSERPFTSFCESQLRDYLDVIGKLWDIPVNPKHMFRDMREMAVARDPKLPRAFELVPEFRRARRRLIRCSAREAVRRGLITPVR